jgi:hypothetical protein
MALRRDASASERRALRRTPIAGFSTACYASFPVSAVECLAKVHEMHKKIQNVDYDVQVKDLLEGAVLSDPKVSWVMGVLYPSFNKMELWFDSFLTCETATVTAKTVEKCKAKTLIISTNQSSTSPKPQLSIETNNGQSLLQDFIGKINDGLDHRCSNFDPYDKREFFYMAKSIVEKAASFNLPQETAQIIKALEAKIAKVKEQQRDYEPLDKEVSASSQQANDTQQQEGGANGNLSNDSSKSQSKAGGTVLAIDNESNTKTPKHVTDISINLIADDVNIKDEPTNNDIKVFMSIKKQISEDLFMLDNQELRKQISAIYTKTSNSSELTGEQKKELMYLLTIQENFLLPLTAGVSTNGNVFSKEDNIPNIDHTSRSEFIMPVAKPIITMPNIYPGGLVPMSLPTSFGGITTVL